MIFVRCERLIARKLAVLLGFNRGVRPFHAACHFDELSRGFVLCLFTLASETILQRHHNAFFYTEIDDHGVHQGNTGRIIARWRRPVAYKVALNMLSRAMRSSPHWRIVVVVKMANDGNTFVRCCRLFCLTNCSKITLIVIIN